MVVVLKNLYQDNFYQQIPSETRIDKERQGERKKFSLLLAEFV
jgi:hypothetical protein